jgi:hypothetical protein
VETSLVLVSAPPAAGWVVGRGLSEVKGEVGVRQEEARRVRTTAFPTGKGRKRR